MSNTVAKAGNLRNARKIARAYVIESRNNGTPATANVLRRDGDTEVYQAVGRRVTRTIRAGHFARGMHIDPSDLPCVV